jgi:hypothetical protein
VNGSDYRASIFVKLFGLAATGVRISVRNAAGALIASGATFSTLDEWTRLDVGFTANATGNWRVCVEQVGAGTATFHATGLLAELGAGLNAYWDGDSPGSSWTGTPHGSTSTQPADPDDHFEAIVGDLEEKLAKLRDEGGSYSRPFRAGRLLLDVEGLGGGSDGAYEGRRWIQRGQRFAWALECLPHGRGEEQLRELRSQTTDPVLVFTETLIPGSVRALGELEIADTVATARRGCVAALEVPDYDYTAATAALYYQAETLTPLGDSVLAASAGAVGAGNNTIKSVLESNWRQLASTKIAASGKHLTHVGVFRIFARVRAAGFVEAGDLQYLLEWGQGDLVERSRNEAAVIAASQSGGYFLLDLGLVRIEKAKVGAQRWEGVILGRSNSPTGSFKPESFIDDLRIVPVSHAYLKARAPRPKLAAATSLTNLDNFNQTAGVLNGKTADKGGVWATLGAATDLQVSTVADALTGMPAAHLWREASGERKAILPTSIAGAVAARVTARRELTETQLHQGLFLRYVDASNYARVNYDVVKNVDGTFSHRVYVIVLVAGVPYVVNSVDVPQSAAQDIVAYALASGYLAAFRLDIGGAIPPEPLIEIQEAVLATGGTLASGKTGIYDYATAATDRRTFDGFQTWVPSEPVLIASGRRLRWRHDGVQREDAAGGDQWSEVGYEGDPLYIPPATKEKRVARAIVFPTRGDLETVPDSGASDDFTAQLAIVGRHVNVRG